MHDVARLVADEASAEPASGRDVAIGHDKLSLHYRHLLQSRNLWVPPENGNQCRLAGSVLPRTGENALFRKINGVAGLLILAACSHHPRTDRELQGEAQQAVDRKLGIQATFSLMESIAAQNIACGHASAPEAPGGGAVDRDFVYRDRRVILDDDPDFDQAAVACDVAAGGGSTADADNLMSR